MWRNNCKDHIRVELEVELEVNLKMNVKENVEIIANIHVELKANET